MWSIQFYLTLLKATIVVIVVVDIDLIVVVNVFVMALHVIADSMIFSCDQ